MLKEGNPADSSGEGNREGWWWEVKGFGFKEEKNVSKKLCSTGSSLNSVV